MDWNLLSVWEISMKSFQIKCILVCKWDFLVTISLIHICLFIRYLDQEAERKRKLQEEVLRREEEAKRRMAKVTKESRTDIAKREVRGHELLSKVTLYMPSFENLHREFFA